MAYNQPMTIYAFSLILFTYQMLFGEVSQTKSPTGVRINYTVSPSTRGVRKLESLTSRSDHIDISQRGAIQNPKTLVNQKNLASLKPTHSSPRDSLIVNTFEGNIAQPDEPGNTLGVNFVDDFQPTTPGRSPGAGHPAPTSRDHSPDQLTKIPKREYTPDSEDDYRRTSPGRSPGAGHGIEDANRELYPKTGKLQNTFPSSSEARQSFFTDSAESTKYYQPQYLPSSGELMENKNEFQSPNLGDSPGARDSFVSKTDNLTSEHNGVHLGETKAHTAGQIDDYRPTAPGHSPGAGHATLKGNRKLNL